MPVPPRSGQSKSESQASRDWFVTLGLAATATAAAVSSFAGLRELAVVTGWPTLLAPLLPLTINSYAMTSVRVWLSISTRSQRARRFARANAIGAILLSLVGNAVWHLIAAKLLTVSWVIVLGTGSVPALALGLVTHMAVLRTHVGPSGPGDALSATGDSGGRPQYRDEDELLAAARVADAAYRAEHDGQRITRDELRKALRISGQRATELARKLRA